VHVVTQNVDNLHERAGSNQVHHVHGSLFEFRCDQCQSVYQGTVPAMPKPVERVEPPRCTCGGLVRPNVVWFGEALPNDAWRRSVDAVISADLVVAVGTSSVVYPAAGLPELAVANGTPVVEVNPEATPLSDSATMTLRESAATALPGLLQRVSALVN
nr:NAD-dependent protein deacylase [Actinomycetes bacterium]